MKKRNWEIWKYITQHFCSSFVYFSSPHSSQLIKNGEVWMILSSIWTMLTREFNRTVQMGTKLNQQKIIWQFRESLINEMLFFLFTSILYFVAKVNIFNYLIYSGLNILGLICCSEVDQTHQLGVSIHA